MIDCCFAVQTVNDDSYGYFEWKPEEESPLHELADCSFSNPLSFRYIVRGTGEIFISHHDDRKKVYAGFLYKK